MHSLRFAAGVSFHFSQLGKFAIAQRLVSGSLAFVAVAIQSNLQILGQVCCQARSAALLQTRAIDFLLEDDALSPLLFYSTAAADTELPL